jgi:hypothetical protein
MADDKPLISDAAGEASMRFAMDAIKRIPENDPEALEAHLTAVLVVFWGALWGTFGTDYARDFIQAQLRGMEPERRHDIFRPPRKH